jgi:transcription initiation factor IIE alpha subunit
MSEKEDTEDEESPEGLTCPKCGAELADTEENRAYAKMRKAS